ncbi:transposase family protein [Geodermatophilus sp. SYSU D00867]
MIEATGSPREAANALFDLPGYRVVDVVDRLGQLRQGIATGTADEAPCPSCGVPSARVHQRRRQRLAEVPIAGPVEMVLVRRRLACVEQLCDRRTFVEASDEVPRRAWVTPRLRRAVLEAVVSAGWVVAKVAGADGLSRWTVQRTVNAAADALTDPDTVLVRRLGVDEHRYHSVRFFRDPAGGWRHYEPVDDHAGRRRHRSRARRGRRAGLRRRERLAGRATTPGAPRWRWWRSTRRRRSAGRCASSSRGPRSAWTPSTW